MSAVTREDFTFLSADGVHAVHCFCVAPEQPKAILQIEHGIAEHIERYIRFAERMAAAGYAVFADDHLGHGKTAKNEEELLWFAERDGWTLVCRDVLTLREQALSRFPGLPFLLMGHSMGSFIVRTVALDHSDLLDGLIISGTGHQSGPVIFAGKTVAAMETRRLGSAHTKSKLVSDLAFSAYNKKFAPNRTAHDWLTRDEAEIDRYEADPLCGGDPTIGLFRDMLTGLDQIRRKNNIRKMRPDLPVYFMSGEADPVGGMSKGVKTVYRLFKKRGMTDLTLRLYPKGRHELLNGPDRDRVITELTAWTDRVAAKERSV